MITDSAAEIAWATGLFEGEGHFCLRQKPNSRAYLEVGITSTDQDVLLRWAATFGTNVRSRKTRAAHHKPQWVTTPSGAEAIRIAELMRPFLCKRRTARLNELLDVIRDNEPKQRTCLCCGETFTPTHFKDLQRHCSIDCTYRAKYLRREYGTDNLAAARLQGYRTHPSRSDACIRGHAFDVENTRIYRRANGVTERRCRACGRLDNQKARERLRSIR